MWRAKVHGAWRTRDGCSRLLDGCRLTGHESAPVETRLKKLNSVKNGMYLQLADCTERRPRLHAGMLSMKTASRERPLRRRQRLPRCPRASVRLPQSRIRWAWPRSSPTTCTPCARDNVSRRTTRRQACDGSLFDHIIQPTLDYVASVTRTLYSVKESTHLSAGTHACKPFTRHSTALQL